MNHNVEGLFLIAEFWGEYTIRTYLKKDDPSVTEIEIPAECNGLPVTRLQSCFSEAEYIKRAVIPPSVRVIDTATFYGCKSLESIELPEGLEEIGSLAFRETDLKSVTLPKSLKKLGGWAFACCNNLKSVIFNSANSEISFGEKVFVDCHKLPADVTLMGLVNSRNLGEPFDANAFYNAFNFKTPITPGRDEHLKYIRPDVLELAIKNDCFRNVDVFAMLKFLVETGNAESLRIAEECGLFKSRGHVDKCIDTSVEQGATELTAYLLELKNSKFGFVGGENFEL